MSLRTLAPIAKRWERWAGALLLAAVTFAIYLPCLDAGWFFMDDRVFVTDNPLIQAADGLRRFWFSRQAADYWPVTSSTLWLEWRIWGMQAAGYHATNLALHIAEALLLWALLRRLKVPGAFLGALLFAVHPLNAMSVLWITERKNLMAMLFFLLSIGCFLKAEAAEPEGKPAPSSASGAQWRALSLLACALGMLSKGSVVFLPLVLLGIVAWNRKPTRQDGWRLAWFFVVALGLAAIESRFSTVMRTPAAASLGPLARMLRAAAVVWFYAAKTAWPANLTFDYGLWRVQPTELRWWLPLVAAAAVSAALWHFRRRGSRPALFAWGYFCAALLPVMGFAEVGFMQYSPVSNHYAHLALAGAAAFAGAIWARWRARSSSRQGRWLLTGLAAAAVVGLGLLTWRQNCILSEEDLLYQDILAHNPSSWLAYTNHGLILADAGLYDQAVAEQEHALQIKPDSPVVQNNLGMALYQNGQVEEAISHYEAATKADPALYQAYNNLGAALARAGRIDEAIKQFRAALALQPDYAGARSNLAHVEQVRQGVISQ